MSIRDKLGSVFGGGQPKPDPEGFTEVLEEEPKKKRSFLGFAGLGRQARDYDVDTRDFDDDARGDAAADAHQAHMMSAEEIEETLGVTRPERGMTIGRAGGILTQMRSKYIPEEEEKKPMTEEEQRAYEEIVAAHSPRLMLPPPSLTRQVVPVASEDPRGFRGFRGFIGSKFGARVGEAGAAAGRATGSAAEYVSRGAAGFGCAVGQTAAYEGEAAGAFGSRAGEFVGEGFGKFGAATGRGSGAAGEFAGAGAARGAQYAASGAERAGVTLGRAGAVGGSAVRMGAQAVGTQVGRGSGAAGQFVGEQAGRGSEAIAFGSKQVGMAGGRGGAAVGEYVGEQISSKGERLKLRLEGKLSPERQAEANVAIARWRQLYAGEQGIDVNAVVLSRDSMKVLEVAVQTGIPLVGTSEKKTEGQWKDIKVWDAPKQKYKIESKLIGGSVESVPFAKSLGQLRLEVREAQSLKRREGIKRFEEEAERFRPVGKALGAMAEGVAPHRGAYGIGSVARVAPRMGADVYAGFATTKLPYAGMAGGRARSATAMMTTPASQTRAMSMLLPKQKPAPPGIAMQVEQWPPSRAPQAQESYPEMRRYA